MATDVSSPVDRLAAVEASIVGFTTAEKLELIERIARSIRSGTVPLVGPTDPAERAEWQYRNRMETLAAIVALAEGSNDDGFSNRDHDKILYGSP
jgi:hypothetical protein